MKLRYRVLVALVALCLCALPALAEGLENPVSWLGLWEGGADYGEARDYYLELLDYDDGVFSASLTYYRLSYFDGMTAFVTGADTAVLSTAADDDFTVLATLDFLPSGIELRVLDSDDPYLEAGTAVLLERSTESWD